MSQWITPGIDAPENRNLFKELTKIQKAQVKFAPEQYALEAQYGPQYNRLDIAKAGENMLGYTDAQGTYHPGTAALGRYGAQVQRQGDIADVMRLGPQATQAILASNPFLAGSLQNLYGRTADSPILQTLNQQAMAGLQSGGQLSPQDVRASDQAARAAYSARGLATGEPAAAAEVLNRDAAVRQRLAGAQQLATGVQGLNQQQAEQVARASQIFSGTLSDPFQAILGRPGLGATAALPGGGPQGRTYGPQDYLSYGQDLFNTNYNAGVNLGIAQSNAQAATRAAIASIAGSAAKSDRRLKENIVKVGESPSGHAIYEFNYKIEPRQRWRGVMADEVEKIRPDAVSTSAGGFKFVDYSKIDVRMEAILDAV